MMNQRPWVPQFPGNQPFISCFPATTFFFFPNTLFELMFYPRDVFSSLCPGDICQHPRAPKDITLMRPFI